MGRPNKYGRRVQATLALNEVRDETAVTASRVEVVEQQVCNLFELLEDVSIEAANNKRRIGWLEGNFGTAVLVITAAAAGFYLANSRGNNK